MIAGRYTLGETIGHGGASVVYAADDAVTGRQVALKLLHPGGPQIGDRARREVAALRLLRLPGVVTLQDEGVHDASPFLVMELVDGAPFPGRTPPAEWTDIAAPTLSMLETLARVHAAGVVHRDLKPSNVLVGEDLNCTLLDFGVAWGSALGEALTAVGGIVGTPEYLAPEQLMGIRGDPRSDLYAVGVMLYEALTGRLPHVATNLFELMNMKRTVTPLPVRQLAEDTPRRVAQTIEQLLAVQPEERPHSVGEVLLQLFDQEVTKRLATTLPRLGDPGLVPSVAKRVLDGGSVDVNGPRGTGRSRLLTDVAERVAAAKRKPRWVPPGTAPYSSALAVSRDVEGGDDLTPDELEERLADRLVSAVGDGAVFLVDDPHHVDEWSARVFERARESGGFVRVVPEAAPADVTLSRLSEEDLRPLFAGPDRIFHLREDGAAELFRRTGGLPSRIAAEIGAWVRAGLARWQDGEVAISRDALQRLAGGLPVITSPLRDEDDDPDAPGLQELLAWISLAWPHTSEDVLAKATKRPRWRLQPELEELAKRHRITRLEDGRYQPVASTGALRTWPADRLREAHRSLADTLPPGTPDRLRHLAAAGTAEEVISEAQRRAESLRREGRFADAVVALEQGLVAARRDGDSDRECRLLRELVQVCLDDGTKSMIQQGLYDLGRALDRSPEIERLAQLLVIARDVDDGDPAELGRAIENLGALVDSTFEMWRQAQRFRLAMRKGLADEARVIRELTDWVRSTGDSNCEESVARWRALHLEHVGNPKESARLLSEAARTDTNATTRLADLLNAGMAFLAAGDEDSAESMVREVEATASAGRAAAYEAQAACFLRQIQYRRGLATEPDVDLVEAIAVLRDPALDGKISITEAAVAWRQGDLELARELAARCTDACLRYGEPGCDALPRALEIVCGRDAGSDELDELERIAATTTDAEMAVEALGLLALVRTDRASVLRQVAAQRAEELTYDDPGRPRIVVSIDEATGRRAVRRQGVEGSHRSGEAVPQGGTPDGPGTP